MEQLKVKLEEIIKKKQDVLDNTDDALIDYAILDAEIQDATDLLEYLRNGISYEDKIKAMRSTRFTTTSASIHRAISECLETEL
jgi:hypothetical protein